MIKDKIDKYLVNEKLKSDKEIKQYLDSINDYYKNGNYEGMASAVIGLSKSLAREGYK